MVAHQHISEDERDKGRILNSQKGVTWSENDGREEMGTIDTPPTNIASERHTSEEKKAGNHPTTGGGKPETCLIDKTASENGTNKEESK